MSCSYRVTNILTGNRLSKAARSQIHDGEGGKTKVLLSVISWSQMHVGEEGSTEAALAVVRKSQIHDGEGGSEPYEYYRTI